MGGIWIAGVWEGYLEVKAKAVDILKLCFLTFPFWALQTFFGMTIAFFLISGILILPWRIFIFLKEGYWLNSVCETTSLIQYKYELSKNILWCDFDSSWLGIKIIMNWFLNSADATFSFLIISMFLFLCCGGIVIASILTQEKTDLILKKYMK